MSTLNVKASSAVENLSGSLQNHAVQGVLQDVIDALSAHIAVLDSDGFIVAVNTAWREFADSNGGRLPRHGVGMNYLTLSRPSDPSLSLDPHSDAPEVLAVRTHYGIKQVLAGDISKFQLTYPCHSPSCERWFLLTVTRLTIDARPGAMVAHEDVTTLKQHEEAITQSLIGTVETIGDILRLRDPYTAAHEQNVACIAELIGETLGMGPGERRGLLLSGRIHDIGKISIPAEILAHPGRLSPIAMELVRTHSVAGYELVRNIDFPWPLADVIRQHHERMDGSGYPDGLAGDDICIEARIVAVADVVDAISSHRPYRPARGAEAANEEIRRGKGTVYDREVVRAYFSAPVQALVSRLYQGQSGMTDSKPLH